VERLTETLNDPVIRMRMGDAIGRRLREVRTGT
jgi:hypothetical protein